MANLRSPVDDCSCTNFSELRDPGLPARVFRVPFTGLSSYDVSPDGRFLMNTIMDAAPESSSVIRVVINWQTN